MTSSINPSAINDADLKTSDLRAQLTNAASDINTLQTDVSNNASSITTNSNDIAANTGNITANANSITTINTTLSGYGNIVTHNVAEFAQVANNLSDLANAATARTNLGLGSAATLNTGTTAGDVLTVSTGDSRYATAAQGAEADSNAATIAGYGNIVTHNAADFAQTANNLSDLASAATARSNLGLGTAATVNTGTGAANVPTTSEADGRYLQLTGGTLTGDLETPSLNGGQLAGLRNKIINGNFQINQRGYTSGAALAAGAYAHDRWKAGANGCTYTFTQGTVDTTITITAGSLKQIVEAANNEGGTFTVSWTGTATASVNGGTAAASPITVTGLSSGTQITVELGTGTVGVVQVETGSTATPFERRPIGLELALCQRYFERITTIDRSGGFPPFGSGVAISSTGSQIVVLFQLKRIVPSVSTSPATTFQIAAPVSIPVSNISTSNVSKTSVLFTVSISSGLTANNAVNLVSDNTTAYMDFDAEL